MPYRSTGRLARRRARRVMTDPLALLASLLLLFVVLPIPAFAHGELRSASPANGDSLSTAPHEIRLSFTEAVELAVSRLTLSGPDGPVALGALALAPDSSTVMIARIDGALVAGNYTVRWQAVGADGHPVRGEYTFTIASGAPGLAAAQLATAPPPTTAAPAAMEEPRATESSGSSALLWIIGAVGIGVVALVMFQLLGREQQSDDSGEHV